jgi:ribosome biogenesis protein MAK21
VQQPEDAAAAAEVFRDVPLDSPAAAAAAGDDSEEEVFRDVDDSGDEAADTAAAAAGRKKQQQQQKLPEANGTAAAAAAAWPKEGCYDMRKREPLYANAEGSCWWELLVLSRHTHPSVAAFARR